jgi:hypothetical protein
MNLTHEAALGCTTSSGLSLRHFDANPIQYNFRIKCHHELAALPMMAVKRGPFSLAFRGRSRTLHFVS